MFNFFKKIFQEKNQKKKNFFVNLNTLQEEQISEWAKKIKLKNKLTENLLDELKILLIKSDLGIESTQNLISQMRKNISSENLSQPKYFLNFLRDQFLLFYKPDNATNIKNNISTQKPQIYLFVGVNGSGKTTTIGKLATKLTEKHQKVLLIAADTFRTGAVEQLKSWSNISKSIFFSKANSQPASVIFEGLKYGENQNSDIILCDTSGRLQNKDNLMKELAKIDRVIKKYNPQAPHEIFLILDAMTGQEALKQVESFNKLIPVTSIILTKFDHFSKGGLILAIKHLYQLETKYIGIGEKSNDLLEFDIQNYVNCLFDNS
ncbi:MAG: signal recognition particle-docking protein FtsY [Pigeon pea little leaf phytoplasma]|uniref:Signal recognition particle-docking protein FtsY n=1 Tax=Candidatus Phytoplasma fabacearum TaxID=2982628 RepID=A0ABU8ZST2_9MOLU|nr:signal recognition particle-docking protein FtsY ['Bituminaria bituminosa' little leaf phytoplasma]MDV3149044.1 signal recognition particle-docking protein FtsY [Pigeon pea little leaf phytoplasma]MDO7983744.1 signal recognition particle-docking protein FtsY ['Bituminaria bituminosa' little leaf phytoplasma]MDO8024055.1 signal recognition particle-docking protein FtsY ['Bituminaria bituminosa' little leaf phytoplasma]MDO8030760.1 signal recognition particle-docking protein FtsY ['Bituminaria